MQGNFMKRSFALGLWCRVILFLIALWLTPEMQEWANRASATVGAASSVLRVPELSQSPCDVNSSEGDKDSHSISYHGITFTYGYTLASECRAETARPVILQSSEDKPDSVTPSHVMFTFLGAYAAKHRKSFFEPQIHVYPIEDYKQALAASPGDVQDLESIIQQLETLVLDSRGAKPRINAQLPFLPYGLDASQSITSHFTYLTFRQGRGIAYLTQYNIEPSLVNNEGLAYTFQGLTYDRRYYISAIFPVTSRLLPDSYAATTSEGYELKYPKRTEQWVQFNREFKTYLLKISERLDVLLPDTFEPSLGAFNKLVESLCIGADK